MDNMTICPRTFMLASGERIPHPRVDRQPLVQNSDRIPQPLADLVHWSQTGIWEVPTPSLSSAPWTELAFGVRHNVGSRA